MALYWTGWEDIDECYDQRSLTCEKSLLARHGPILILYYPHPIVHYYMNSISGQAGHQLFPCSLPWAHIPRSAKTCSIKMLFVFRRYQNLLLNCLLKIILLLYSYRYLYGCIFAFRASGPFMVI